MSDDWDKVVVLRKKAPRAAQMKSETAINQAIRSGQSVSTQQKYNAGTNKQHVVTKNTAKLDSEHDELKHKHVPLDVGKLIQQGRQGKNMSQKELATKINEKPQIIQEYEQGKAIPNNVVLGKIETVIGVRLRGKKKGEALFAAPKK